MHRLALVCLLVGACAEDDPEQGASDATRVELPPEKSFCVTQEDGTQCAAERVCFGGECRFGCVVSATFFEEGAVGKAGCGRCDPFVGTDSLVELPDGTQCDELGVCIDSTCQPLSCFIEGARRDQLDRSPQSDCQWCQPSVARDAWSPVVDGATCETTRYCLDGRCAAACRIDEQVYEVGAHDPDEICHICNPELDRQLWTWLPQGTSCGEGRVCDFGDCVDGCTVGDVTYPHGPVGECLTCEPDSPHFLRPRPNGTTCGEDSACYGGVCSVDCVIDTVQYFNETRDPQNACRWCDPDRSHTAFVSLFDGADCDDASVCLEGTCTRGCWANGKYVAPGSAPDDEPCVVCEPDLSVRDLESAPDGFNAGCPAATVCFFGECYDGCFIDGKVVERNVAEPGNLCRMCRPEVSTSDYSPRDDGFMCGFQRECVAGVCVDR